MCGIDRSPVLPAGTYKILWELFAFDYSVWQLASRSWAMQQGRRAVLLIVFIPLICCVQAFAIGTSHQEPMLRAQKEWDRRYRKTLGNWNYYKNLWRTYPASY
jgi:hypothetical protein